MVEIKILNDSISDIMKKIAEEQYDIVLSTETLEPFLYDKDTKEIYFMPEEVDYWRGYIWRYNHSRPAWNKIYSST